MLYPKSTAVRVAVLAALAMILQPLAPAAQESGADQSGTTEYPDAAQTEWEFPQADDEPAKVGEDSSQSAESASAQSETPASASGAATEPDTVAAADGDAGSSPQLVPTIPVAKLRPAAEPSAPEPGSGAAQLEDVIVTSTKRAQPLRDIAASIDQFSGEKLESEGKINLADYIESKPGVVMSNIAPNLLRISIRGISTDTSGTSPLPSPTGVFVGDTAFSDPYISNIQPDFNAFDLSSVEILKGPQGTLFGGAALAGAIRFVMQEPLLGTWQARGFAQYDMPRDGSPALSSGVVLNAPLWDDDLAVRLAYMKREYPAIYDNSREDVGREDVDGGKSDQLRGLLSWRPFERLGVKFTHLEQDSTTPDGVGFADSPDGPRENNKKILPQPSLAEFGLDSLEIAYDFDTVRAVWLTSRNTKNWDAYVDGTAALYGTPPEGFSPLLGAFSTIVDDSKAWAHEFRVQSTDGDGLQWLGGLYYFDYEVFFEIMIDTIANQRLFGASGYPGDVNKTSALMTSLLYATSDVTAYERAAFADLSYKFWDRLDVSIGARYYETQVKGGFYGTGLVPRSQNGGEDINYTDNEITEDGINPKISAAFEVSRGITLWASASRGFRFGGLQSVPSPGPPGNNVPESYESDTLWNYELGARTAWFDNTLHFDTTLFYIDYQNPQLVQSTEGGVVNYNYTDNVAGAVSLGFEMALTWLTPLEGLRIDLAGGLTDAHTTEDFVAAGGTLVPAGAKMPGAAESQYSVALGYAAPPIGIFDLRARLDYAYVGPGKSDIRQIHDINDYGTLNGGITLTTLAWPLKPHLAFNVSNIFDETGVKLASTIAPILPTGSEYVIHYLNQPRTFSLRLGLEF